MPLYNTITAAAALGVTPKWLDNILSHNEMDGVQRSSQGISRRLSLSAITTLSLAKELIDSLHISTSAALNIAARLAEDSAGDLILSPRLRVIIRTDLIKTDVLTRLTRAVESSPTPRRGRPPKR
jgi:hypothetical protein